MEVEYSSKHQDKKFQILNMKVWVETREREVKGEIKELPIILYEFYTNSVASKVKINSRSTLSWNSNRVVLTEEILRVLINCSKLLLWENVTQHVNEVVLRMQYSGYNKKLRNEVVDSALKAYRAKEEAEQEGE